MTYRFNREMPASRPRDLDNDRRANLVRGVRRTDLALKEHMEETPVPVDEYFNKVNSGEYWPVD